MVFEVQMLQKPCKMLNRFAKLHGFWVFVRAGALLQREGGVGRIKIQNQKFKIQNPVDNGGELR